MPSNPWSSSATQNPWEGLVGGPMHNQPRTPEQAGFSFGMGPFSSYSGGPQGSRGRFYRPGDNTGRTLGQLQSGGFLNSQTMMDQLLGANFQDYARDMQSQRFNWEQNQRAIDKLPDTASRNAQGIRDSGQQGFEHMMGLSRDVAGQGRPFTDQMTEYARRGAEGSDEWARKADQTMADTRKGFADDSAQQASIMGLGNQRALDAQKTNNLVEAGGAYGQTGGQLEAANQTAERDSRDRNTQMQAQIHSQFNTAKASLGQSHADLQARLAQIKGASEFGAGSLMGDAANVNAQYAGLGASLAQAGLGYRDMALSRAAELEQQGLRESAQFTMANPFAPTSIFDAMLRGAAIATTPGPGGGQLFAQHGGFNMPQGARERGVRGGRPGF